MIVAGNCRAALLVMLLALFDVPSVLHAQQPAPATEYSLTPHLGLALHPDGALYGGVHFAREAYQSQQQWLELPTIDGDLFLVGGDHVATLDVGANWVLHGFVVGAGVVAVSTDQRLTTSLRIGYGVRPAPRVLFRLIGIRDPVLIGELSLVRFHI